MHRNFLSPARPPAPPRAAGRSQAWPHPRRPSRHLRIALIAGVAALLAALASARTAPKDERLEEADRLWASRAEPLEGRLATVESSERALSAYREAIPPDAPVQRTIEARWKALRAAHYLSEFSQATEARGDQAIEEATRLADASLDAIAKAANTEHLSDLSDEALQRWLGQSGLAREDVAELHFWSAIVWGAQAQRVGLLTIVREGIASRMYENATLATRLAPEIERGGAYRLLSRLHADLPRVPFVSGWVDREKALPLAEQAMAIAPDDPGNQMILALALRDQDPPPFDRIEALLESAANHEPRPSLLAEDLAIREEAAERLAELREED